MPQARALYQTAGDGLGHAFRELGSLGKEVDQAIAKQDNVINVMMPEATAQFMKTEQERYARIVKKADVKSDRGYP